MSFGLLRRAGFAQQRSESDSGAIAADRDLQVGQPAVRIESCCHTNESAYPIYRHKIMTSLSSQQCTPLGELVKPESCANAAGRSLLPYKAVAAPAVRRHGPRRLDRRANLPGASRGRRRHRGGQYPRDGRGARPEWCGGGGALLAERRRSVVGAGRSAATRQPDKRRVAWSSAEIHSKADTVELRALQ